MQVRFKFTDVYTDNLYDRSWVAGCRPVKEHPRVQVKDGGNNTWRISFWRDDRPFLCSLVVDKDRFYDPDTETKHFTTVLDRGELYYAEATFFDDYFVAVPRGGQGEHPFYLKLPVKMFGLK